MSNKNDNKNMSNENDKKNKSGKNDNKDKRKKSEIHKGHRARMDDRFRLDQEFNSFAYHEMLEYLLYLGVPRKDTNELAHRLIERFGSFENVFHSTLEELSQVEGMTLRAASTVCSVLPMSRWLFNKSKERQKHLINNTEKAVEYLWSCFTNRLVEYVYMICLDNADYMINAFPLSKGSASSAPFDVREVVTKANSNMASKVIIAHNHPASTLLPSLDDIAITSRVAAGLGAINILLADHIIFVPDGRYYSFFLKGILKDLLQGIDSILGGDSTSEVYSVLSEKEKLLLRTKKVASLFLKNVYDDAMERSIPESWRVL
ncbi:MAG: hypothetical protein LBU60_00255 [Clostridiales bacterium]|jgi:DNA repair protein RadC|nr:hypothetical protein [Clostridiales bacterium]